MNSTGSTSKRQMISKTPGWLLKLAGLAYLLAAAVAALAIVMYARAMLVLGKTTGLGEDAAPARSLLPRGGMEQGES